MERRKIDDAKIEELELVNSTSSDLCAPIKQYESVYFEHIIRGQQ